MVELEAIYAQVTKYKEGVKIKIHEKANVFANLLNKKLGRDYIQIQNLNDKFARISCCDIRLNKVSFVTSNKRINKLVATAYKKFIELQSSRSWGIESSFLKSLIFCDFAKNYYEEFRPNRKPPIISNTWVTYMNGPSFSPSKNIISIFDQYWLAYWNQHEVQQWLAQFPPDVTITSLFDQEYNNWIEDLSPFFKKLPPAFNSMGEMTLEMKKYNLTIPYTNFPFIVDLDTLIKKIVVVKGFNHSKNILVRFKLALYFRRINLYICKIILENLDTEPVKDEMFESLIVNIRKIFETNFKKYVDVIVDGVKKNSFDYEKTKRTDKSIGQATYMGNEEYIDCGRELCKELDIWLTHVKTSY